jgi:predicted RNA-binding protein YlxR (DUF448 family)
MVAIRTCTGCRGARPQVELIRVAHRGDGTIAIGPGPGRGAYVCPDEGCITAALESGRLARTLRYKGALPDHLRGALDDRTNQEA